MTTWWQRLVAQVRGWLGPRAGATRREGDATRGARAATSGARGEVDPRAGAGAGASATSERGSAGEALAAAWLERERHMRIVARNWRNPADRRDELDLVARDGEVLVFVEVKTRAAGALVPGYFAATTPAKKRVVRRAAAAYLRALPRPGPRTWRFDVVEIAWPAAGKTPLAAGSASMATTPITPMPTPAVTTPPATATATTTTPAPPSPAAPQILHFENVPLFGKHFRG